MIPIKVILIILLLVILRAFLVQKSLMVVHKSIGILTFCFLVFLVLFPDISTRVANAIGVGRGADLVFYLAHLFFLFLVIALWRRTIALTDAMTKLSRTIALQNPKQPDKEDEENSYHAG